MASEVIEESIEDKGRRYIQDLKRRSAAGDFRAWIALFEIEHGSILKNPPQIFRTDVV